MAQGHSTGNGARVAIGLDVGDRKVDCCVVDAQGVVVERSEIPNRPEALRARFEGMRPTRVALEAGTHALWMAQLLKECGHEVLVANPRKLRGLYENPNKSDKVDAEYLARVARLDPELLGPIQPRGLQAHKDLALLKARDQLVQARTQLVLYVRSMVKTLGGRLPSSISAGAFAKKVAPLIPKDLQPVLGPMLETIQHLTEQIRVYEKRIEEAAESYPQTGLLQTVTGVGPLTSMAYVLSVGDPQRFPDSREVGAYFGLVPRKDQSGEQDPELSISKAGNGFVRRLLVGSAHYILGPFGPDSDLRRFGQRIQARGGKVAKKKAAVAVARKLAVVLHHLWVRGETYVPLHAKPRKEGAASPPRPDAPARCARSG